jgi:hypothetical protein
VIVAAAFENVPLAPLPGAVNVTVAPTTGLLLASFTVACSAVVNAVLIVALCEAPAEDVMLAGGGALFVRLKLTDPVTPVALAVTV